jgi:dienelactone hydrolase
VFIPDFYRGGGIHPSWFPPDTEEKQKKLQIFKEGPAQIPPAVTKVPKVIEEIKNLSGGKITKIFGLGFCWGARVAYLSSQDGTLFSGVAGCHPSFVDPNDAPKITVPICVLNSKDEDADVASRFEANLTVEKHVETFTDQIHGWMAGR